MQREMRPRAGLLCSNGRAAADKPREQPGLVASGTTPAASPGKAAVELALGDLGITGTPKVTHEKREPRSSTGHAPARCRMRETLS